MMAWAQRWGISQQAMTELLQAMAHIGLAPSVTASAGTETQVQQELRVLAPHHDGHLWRNNSGALKDDRGNMVRYGLANDSTRLNKVLKSSDLIGFTSLTIQPSDVGRRVAVFTAVEAKKPGWKAPTNERETAQATFLKLVHAGGGIATFATAPTDYLTAIERWKTWQL